MTDSGPIIRRFLALLVLTGGLAACGGVSNKMTDLFHGKVQLACPTYNIVADAARQVKFRPGNGRDLTDVDSEIVIQTAKVDCYSDVNRDTLAGSMRVNVDITFMARRGPANTDRRATFKYFVAVTDRADKVLYREAFDLGTTFPGNESRRILDAPTTRLNIPILSGQSGENFRVLVGLVLTHEQLNYNRKDRETPMPFGR